MVQNVYEVFSSQETKVFRLRYNEKKSIKEIATMMECSPNTIKEYCKRIKKKIKDLQLLDNVTLAYEPEVDEIEEIFNEENNRTLAKKTVSQVQFLSELNKMSSKKHSTSAIRKRKHKMGLANTVFRGTLSDEERANLRINAAVPLPASHVTSAYAQYYNWYNNPPDLESMAALEVILRAHGLLYRTPFINQLNRKTSLMMRANETGYQTTIVKPGEGILIPPRSKFVESVKDEYGRTEYSIWLFPQAFCRPKSAQKRKQS